MLFSHDRRLSRKPPSVLVTYFQEQEEQEALCVHKAKAPPPVWLLPELPCWGQFLGTIQINQAGALLVICLFVLHHRK